jgi:hypothetical protein
LRRQDRLQTVKVWTSFGGSVVRTRASFVAGAILLAWLDVSALTTETQAEVAAAMKRLFGQMANH